MNLCDSNGSDIALHLNPRLKKSVFVRNSFLGQSWGPEETAGATFPFVAGRYFEVGHASTSWKHVSVCMLAGGGELWSVCR